MPSKLFLYLCVISILFVACVNTKNVAGKEEEKTKKKDAVKKKDRNDHRGLAAFFLQDPNDELCLGPNGFVMCDENALWLLTTRSGRNTYSLVSFLNPSQNVCLQRKTKYFGLMHTDQLVVGSCKTQSALSWEWDWVKDYVQLKNLGKCLVRGKNGIKNSIFVEDCKDIKEKVFGLKYHLTAVHENGFLLATADGNCFDGEKFRPCYTTTQTSSNIFSNSELNEKAITIPYSLYWGVGIKYVWGEAKRYFFNFAFDNKDGMLCLIFDNSRGKVSKGSCNSKNALTWGLQHGKLSILNGQKCVARRNDDTAILTNCDENYEYIVMNIPVTQQSDLLSTTSDSNLLNQKFASPRSEY